MTNPASDTVRIKAGPYAFTAQLLVDQAPKTCEAFRKLLPLRNKIIQPRWSGESAWIPLGDARQLTELENHTCNPSRGDILLVPNTLSCLVLSLGVCQQNVSKFPCAVAAVSDLRGQVTPR